MQPFIAVLGGTGKAGTYLVNQLLEQGFRIRLLLRDPERFNMESPLLEIMQGDARDYPSILAWIQGTSAIISTLGQTPGESPLFSQATTHILRSMEVHNIRRYIVLTGLSIDAPLDKKGDRTRQASEFMRRSYPAIIADKQLELGILLNSQADWTLVRVPLIEQSDLKGSIRISLEDCPGDRISATDLAVFLIEQLSGGLYLCKAPFVASRYD